jgi:hypothetical protein
MEFHGIFHGTEVDGVPWNFPWNSMEFHQPQFHTTEFHEKFNGIPWNSMENSMEFYGKFSWKEFHGKFNELTERFSPG